MTRDMAIRRMTPEERAAGREHAARMVAVRKAYAAKWQADALKDLLDQPPVWLHCWTTWTTGATRRHGWVVPGGVRDDTLRLLELPGAADDSDPRCVACGRIEPVRPSALVVPVSDITEAAPITPAGRTNLIRHLVAAIAATDPIDTPTNTRRWEWVHNLRQGAK